MTHGSAWETCALRSKLAEKGRLKIVRAVSKAWRRDGRKGKVVSAEMTEITSSSWKGMFRDELVLQRCCGLLSSGNWKFHDISLIFWVYILFMFLSLHFLILDSIFLIIWFFFYLSRNGPPSSFLSVFYSGVPVHSSSVKPSLWDDPPWNKGPWK